MRKWKTDEDKKCDNLHNLHQKMNQAQGVFEEQIDLYNEGKKNTPDYKRTEYALETYLASPESMEKHLRKKKTTKSKTKRTKKCSCK